MTQTTDYQKQAIDFLQSTNTEFKAEFLRNGKHFNDDKEVRDIYKITLKRGTRQYSFNFGQSIINSKYYLDIKIPARTYTLSGSNRTGNYKINDIEKYKSGGNLLKLVKGEIPTAYDVLACLTKYDPGTFEDFCGEFGYDADSKKAEKTYNAVREEWLNITRLFTDDEISQLAEIS
mgnify:CR=1 FL=1